eukprot:TRINITY_DN7914_c0_g1_i1.p1 TRINITY_DN7914_c0_g1~~TRINITY_DN7914_c0_g1_i1.p1  ORF type:complete len:796 (+),score=187.83 TRINITY_DN7914_c0_g1_i1:97-2484(+)
MQRSVLLNTVFGVLIPVCLFVVGVAVGMIIVQNEHESMQAEEKDMVMTKGDVAVQEIIQGVSDSLNVAYVLGAFVAGQGNVPIDHQNTNKTVRMVTLDERRFNSFAAPQAEQFPSVSSMQLQPSGIVTQAYPALTPGVNPWGHDLYNDENRREDIRAGIRKQKLVVAGPFPLIQGGVALLSRYPVFFRPENMSLAEFAELTVEETLPYWWGMTASLVSINALLKMIDLKNILLAGEVHYCLEYYNLNAKQVVVIDSQGVEFNVTASVDAGTTRTLLNEHDYHRLDVRLPGERRWNLWVRTATKSDDRFVQQVVVVFVTLIACALLASTYWGPYVARQALYRTLTEVFEEIMVLNLEPDTLPERMPRDSPPAFVKTLTDMVRRLVDYRRFLPESLRHEQSHMGLGENEVDINMDDEELPPGAAPSTGPEPPAALPAALGASGARDPSQTAAPPSETASINSRSSVKASSRAENLNSIETGFLCKSVAVVAMEVETHVTRSVNPKDLDKSNHELLQKVSSILTRNRGCVNVMAGSSFLFEFGAQRPLSSRCQHAVQFAFETCSMKDIGLGIGYGKMSCGNVGTSAHMSFVLCGLQVELSRSLATYGSRSGFSNMLTTAAVHVSNQNHALFLPIDVASFPQWNHQETIYTVLETYSSSTSADDPAGSTKEWMYELASIDKSSTLDAYMQEWRKCLSGAQPALISPTSRIPLSVQRALKRLPYVFIGFEKARGMTVTLSCPATRSPCVQPEYASREKDNFGRSGRSNVSGPIPASPALDPSPSSSRRSGTDKQFFGVCS